MEELIFGSKEHINAWQECARALVIFPYGLLLIRLVGRRVFGKWSALDFIISIIVGSALGRVMTGGAPLLATLAACTFLMALHWALAHYAARHKFFSWILEGSAVHLAEHGKLDHRKMLAHNITVADLDEALREKGIEEVSETKLITIEPSGKINVVPKKP
jgi:uncharacterized membrane protein YcaP (DUF421 family)